MESRIAPVSDIILSHNAVAQSNPKDTLVGLFSSSDASRGGKVQFSLISGMGSEDNYQFSIVGEELRTTESFNLESRSSHSIRVLASDSAGGAVERMFQVFVKDLNDPPVNMLPSQLHGFAKNQLWINGLSVSDEDSGPSDLKDSMNVPQETGTRYISEDIHDGSLGSQRVGANSNQLTLTGSIVRHETTFWSTNSIPFFSESNIPGNATLARDDLGHTGPVGPMTATNATTLDISAVHKPPRVTLLANPAPIKENGNPKLTDVEKDALNPTGEPVRNLVGLLANDPDVKSAIGIAVTALDRRHGRWQYSPAHKWLDITEVSDRSAFLLGPTTKIRFVPDHGFAGTATLSYHAWDQSVGQIGERADVNVNAFSTSSLTASIQVIARPVLEISTRQTIVTINSSASVDDLLNGTVSDILPGLNVGMAIIGTSGKGVWTYQIGNANPVKMNATAASALLVPGEAILKFTPSAGLIGLATLNYRAWNIGTLSAVAGTRANSAGLAFSKAIETLSVLVPASNGNTRPTIRNRSINLGSLPEDAKSLPGIMVKSLLAKAGISDSQRTDRLGLAISATDQTNGDWQFSLDGKSWAALGKVSTAQARLLPPTARLRFVPNLNFFGTSEISFFAWDGTDGSPEDLADITLDTAFSTDSVTARWNITPVNDRPTLDVSKVILVSSLDAGSSTSSIRASDLLNNVIDVETPANQIGIAINVANGPGNWQFSSDGKNFIPLTSLPVLLSPSAMLRFVGNSGKTGIATLNYQAWDGTPARNGRPILDSVSLARSTLRIAVGNSAPQLTGPGNFDELMENPKSNPGKTVASFLGETFLDSPRSKRGIAVTGVTSPIPGDWQYSLNRGKTWISMNSPNESDAWLLPATAKIRFAPGQDAYSSPGAQPSITYKAWDQTVGVAGQRVDTTDLSVNAFSAAITVQLTISKINQLPKLDTSRLLIVDAPIRSSQLLAGIASSRETSIFGISVISTTGPGTWEVDLGIGFKDMKTIPANISQFNQDAVIRFVPKPGATGVATLRFKAWDPQGDADRVSREIETVSVSLGNHHPVL